VRRHAVYFVGNVDDATISIAAKYNFITNNDRKEKCGI
jgi:hypothetical protein